VTKIVHGTHPTAPLSLAVEAGDFIFLSGHLPFGDDGGIVEGDVAVQTRRVLDNIARTLEPLGATTDDIVKLTIWLTSLADFDAFNETCKEVFPTAPPARATVVSGLVFPAARVEIDAVVYRPRGGG